MSKTKNIVSIVLILMLTMTLTVAIIPMASAATLTVTIDYAGPNIGFYYWDRDLSDWVHQEYPSDVPDFAAAPGVYLLKFPARANGDSGPRFRGRATIASLPEGCTGRSEGAQIINDVPHLKMKVICSGSEITAKYGHGGPKIDVVRMKVIKGPDMTLIAMKTGAGDVAPGLIRTGDIEELDSLGFTITFNAGFHMGFMGYNIREDQTYRRPDIDIGEWPLADVMFRLALFHCYDQEAIIAGIYGYTVTPVQSLIPPAQGGWVNPNVPKIPYNPGVILDPEDPHYLELTFAPGSSTGILQAAGYTFVDINGNGKADLEDYWTNPLGYDIPQIKLFTPTYETAPTSAEHGARFVADLAEIGLAATTENALKGFTHEPAEFADYMDKVDTGLFDAYMVFWSLGRFPDHVYDMCHSSQDVLIRPHAYNAPGIHSDEIDALVTIIKTSLDHTAKMEAAYEVQRLLYDPSCDQALAYMLLYSRILFNAFNPDLRGIVKSPGYGSDNTWTWLNMYWEPGTERYTDGKTVINWIEGEEPERMNPCYASTVYAWDIIDKTLDGLMDVNPYTHEDLSAMAEDWEVENSDTPYPGGMNITYYLRKDVFWQDGNPYTANDAKFNWEFFRDNEIPRYLATWQYIKDVEVIDDYTVKVLLNTTSQFLLYDVAGIAAVLPPPVWTPWDGADLALILGYDPSIDTTEPTGAGPWWGTAEGPNTCLYGTGPFIFDYYDPVGMVAEIHSWGGYYKATEDISNHKTEMFHSCGDVDRDGSIWTYDQGIMGQKYGMMKDIDPAYDPDVDVTNDGIIDVFDISLVNYFYGDQKEWP